VKGIIFTNESIKAIVELRKTVTRRVIKGLETLDGSESLYLSGGYLSAIHPSNFHGWFWVCDGKGRKIKPRYQVGETVYIKEAFMFKAGADIRELDVGTPRECFLGKPPFYLYRLDNTQETKDYARYYKWRSPMMMPQKAARYFILIKANSVEQLRLPLSPEELTLEGGEAALPILEKINGLWVFRYEFKLVEGGK
jgi:hypothetical protein